MNDRGLLPFRQQLLYLRDRITHADLLKRLTDLLRRWMRIARKAVIHARRRIGIRRAASTASSTATAAILARSGSLTRSGRRFTRKACIASGFPLLWRLPRWIERDCFFGWSDIHRELNSFPERRSSD